MFSGEEFENMDKNKKNNTMKKIVQTAGRTQLGEFAPEFAHLNDDILFGEVIARPQFSNNHFAHQPRNHR